MNRDGSIVSCMLLVIEEVLRIEPGDGDIEKFQGSHPAVPAPRPDHDSGQGPDRNHLPVEFKMPFSLENHINLGRLPVVVAGRLFGELEEVDRGRAVFSGGESPPHRPATALEVGKTRELNRLVPLHRYNLPARASMT